MTGDKDALVPPLGTLPATPLPFSSTPGASGPAVVESHVPPEPVKLPAVTVEWIGPATARLGQPVTCAVVIKNTSTVPASQVMVRAPLPAGVTVRSTEPKATIENNAVIWNLDTLPALQERRLEMQLVPETKGDLSCQAVVTFSGSTTAKMLVREPKLAIKASGPEKTLLGDTAVVTLMFSNTGDGPTEHIKVKVTLPGTSEQNPLRTAEFTIKDLAANESRGEQLRVVTKAEGQQKCEITAVAEGNLKAQDDIVLNVIQPRLELTLTDPSFVISIARPPMS